MGRPVVVWARQALDDLDDIERFIEQDSPAYAQAVVSRIVKVAASVEDPPGAARRLAEFDLDRICERVVYSYRLIYRVSTQLVEILAVIQGRRPSTSAARSMP